MPCSLARSPYDTVIDVSTRAVAVPRAGSEPFSPVYHITVSAAVPATRLVALLGGEPETRWGGLPKKSLPAATAEAAVSDVSASLAREALNAPARFPAVTSDVA